MQPTYGQRCLALRSVRWWCCEFAKGREDLHDNERSRRPRSSLTDDISRVDAMLKADRRVHIKDISREFGISYGSVYDIVYGSLGCRKVSCRWVPKQLDDMMKGKRMIASLNHLRGYTEEGQSFLECIFTGDETWIQHPTPESKQQSMVW
ncbi:unnamed protein product, partial [Ixodes pacificus]